MTDEEIMTWLDGRIARYPTNEYLKVVRARLLGHGLELYSLKDVAVSREVWLELELKRKEQQLIVANLETEAALKREFDLDQKLRSLSLAISSASFVKRLRYAFTGRF